MQAAARRPRRIIDSLETAERLFAPAFRNARNERLYIAHLGDAKDLIGLCVRYAGEGQAVDLPIRAILADAITLGSAALILAHNHPSGDPTPTETDIAATRSLVLAARPIHVAVHDHLVFGDGRVVSFRARGLL
jgi:DNA repair protein RadC